jgi:hypothetical protein
MENQKTHRRKFAVALLAGLMLALPVFSLTAEALTFPPDPPTQQQQQQQRLNERVQRGRERLERADLIYQRCLQMYPNNRKRCDGRY